MQFKTKDLLVTVLPKNEITEADLAKLCLLRTFICRNPTFQCFNPTYCQRGSLDCYHASWCGRITYCACTLLLTGGCGFAHSCGPGNSACDPTIFCPGGSRDPFVLQDLEDLTTLRAELQATLKSLDAIQKEGIPGTVATKRDAEAMERGLTDALEQVRAAKKNL